MKKLTRKWFRQAIALMLIVCMVCSNGMLALADEAVASTMRLARTEGTVTVTNKNGRDMGTMADMKLFSGYQMATAQSSYAWITLDDSKLIKLDAVSEAEIQKKGKDLEVLLNSGNLFFNVTESLKSDETLNIRTSTMVTGIRGTSGWVKVIDSWRTRVYILEGQVECWVMDPVSGQYKGVTLRGGQYAEFVVYDQTREGDKCDIITNNYTENDIDGFVAVELMNDPELREKIKGATGFNVDWIAGNAPNKLNQDQQDTNQKVQAINEQVAQQDHNVSRDPLFKDKSDRDSDGGSGGSGSSGGGSSSSGGSSGTTTPDDTTDTTNPDDELTEITLTLGSSDSSLAATAQNVAYYLSLENMQTVTVLAGEGDNDEFEVDESLTVASGQTLIFGTETAGVDVTINADQSLNVVGTVDIVNGTLTNNGSISNVSNNTLKVMGEISNTSTGTINNTGTIRVTADAAGTTVGNVTNAGSIFNGGTLAVNVSVEADGKFEHQAGGTLTGSLTVATGGYAALYEKVTSSLIIDGGELEVCGAKLDTVEFSDGTLRVSTGGSVETVEATGGQVIVDGGSVTTLDWSKPLTGTGSVVVPTAVTINSGTVGTVSTDGGILYINGGTVTTATAKTTAEITDGNVTTLVADSNQVSVYGGNVESVSATSAKVFVSGGEVDSVTYTNSSTKNILLINAGTIGTVDKASAADVEYYVTLNAGSIDTLNVYSGTHNIYGGTIETLNANAGETIVAGGTIETVESATVFRANGGTINTVNATTGFYLGGAEIENLTLNDASYPEITGGVIGTLIIVGDSSDIYFDGTTTAESVIVNGGKLTVSNGTITDGMVVNNDSVVNITGGTISAGEGGFAINAVQGQVVIDSSDTTKQIVIKASDPSQMFNVGTSSTVSYDGTQITSDSFFICVESGTELEFQGIKTSFEEAFSALKSGEILALTRDTEVVVDGSAVTGDMAYLSTTRVGTGNPAVVVDLNGYSLTFTNDDTSMVDIIIGSNVAAGSEEEDANSETSGYNYALEIRDSVGDGVLTTNGITLDDEGSLEINGVEIVLKGSISNSGYTSISDSEISYSGNADTDSLIEIRNLPNGIFEMTDVEAEIEETIWNSGTMKINGGSYRARNGELIFNMGDLTIYNGAVLEAEALAYEDGSYTNMIETGSGKLTIGDVDTDTVEIIYESGEDSYAPSGALIKTVAQTRSLSEEAVSYNGYVEITNAKLTATKGSAVCIEDGFQLTIGKGAELTSESMWGTVTYEAPVDEATYEYPIVFDGGTITNTNENAGAINQYYDEYSVVSTTLIPECSEMGTTIRSFNEDVITNSCCKYYYDGTNDIVTVTYEAYSYYDETKEDYLFTLLGYKVSGPDSEGYYYLADASTLQVMFLMTETPSNAQIKAPSSSEAEENTTGSNTTDATATDSNADGGSTPLTTSPAAIPMAAAAFALMAAVYQVVEDEKKRKER